MTSNFEASESNQQLINNIENESQNFPGNTELNIVQKGNRIITFASGGAFLGGLIAQVPGAITGAIIAAVYATFVKTPTEQPE